MTLPVPLPIISDDQPSNIPNTPDYSAGSGDQPSPCTGTAPATAITQPSTLPEQCSYQHVAGIQPGRCLHDMELGVNALYSTATTAGMLATIFITVFSFSSWISLVPIVIS